MVLNTFTFTGIIEKFSLLCVFWTVTDYNYHGRTFTTLSNFLIHGTVDDGDIDVRDSQVRFRTYVPKLDRTSEWRYERTTIRFPVERLFDKQAWRKFATFVSECESQFNKCKKYGTNNGVEHTKACWVLRTTHKKFRKDLRV